MSATKPSPRRWTEATIEEELRRQIDDLRHFPTRAELVARGLRSLWDAMRTTGGVDTWREKLGGEPVNTAPASDTAASSAPAGDTAASSAPAGDTAASSAAVDDPRPADNEPDGERPVPTDEEIARRAYELYEEGAPGDATSHWLAAKQELT